MEKIKIDGGKRLCGEVSVHGAKNGALPILAATLLIEGESVIHNCPVLSDTEAAIKILTNLGCKCRRDESCVTVDASSVTCCEISESLMREMRSSIVFLGAIIGRCKSARLSYPGGCEIGPRPIDIHLSSMKQLGVSLSEEHGTINCNVEDKINGASIYIPIPSVGATENIMIAAALSNGVTKIYNAAREPEISDLAEFLNKAGADIKGAGTSDIVIVGKQKLHSTEHTVIPDRILTATYMSAVAVTNGDAIIKNTEKNHIKAIISEYEKLGCEIKFSGSDMKIKAPKRLNRLSNVSTQYYPGFPTDAGPMLLATTAYSNGTSIFYENIFENRFKFASELKRMSADIKVSGRTAIVEGKEHLTGANINCTDLRGGAALMIAALGADGESILGEIHHILRGYETPEIYFKKLGAEIKRI